MAHPRSRGENEAARRPAFRRLGSSPLARGKRTHATSAPMASGLIPARAGKTRRARAQHSWVRAHPRSRGENDCQAFAGLVMVGSSPLARGKPRNPSTLTWYHRLIPARAGKTCARISLQSARRAHPRSRGENLIGYSIIQKHLGSSPLARGKPVELDACARRGGLIPARAGKTRDRHRWHRVAAAHPRSRGENPS